MTTTRTTIIVALSLCLTISIAMATPHNLYPDRFSAVHDVKVNQQALSVSDTAVYKQAYYSLAGSDQWTPITLTGSRYGGNNEWLAGTATYTLPLMGEGEHYVITYSCKLLSGNGSNVAESWDCHGGRWQLLVINQRPHTQPQSIAIIAVDASSSQRHSVCHDGHCAPSYTLDGIPDVDEKRWSACGDGEWIQYTLNDTATIDYVDIVTWQKPEHYYIEIQVSNDTTTWQTVYDGQTDGVTQHAFERFSFAPVQARFVRIVGHGNSGEYSCWNSILEVRIQDFEANVSLEQTQETIASYAAIGDSMSDEYTDWPGRFADRRNIAHEELALFAHSGSSCNDVRNQLAEVPNTTDLLFVTCGVNQLASRDNIAAYQAIYQDAKKKGIDHIFMTTMPPWEVINSYSLTAATSVCDKMKADNQWLLDFAQEHSDAHIIDLWTLWHDTSGTQRTDCGWRTDVTLTSDGVHPNAQGYDAWAELYHRLFTNVFVDALRTDNYDIVFGHDFEENTLGKYVWNEWRTDWNSPRFEQRLDETWIVEHDEDKAMKLIYHEGTWGVQEGEQGGGGQWPAPLEGYHEELYLSYDVYLPPGFDIVRSVKLPGLVGGPQTGAGNKPAPDDGFFSSLALHDEVDPRGTIIYYLYYQNQKGDYGDVWGWPDPYSARSHYLIKEALTEGTWVNLAYRLVLNSVDGSKGNADGFIEGFANGRLISRQDGLLLRNYDHIGIDTLWFYTHYGGNGVEWASAKDEWILFDNFYAWRYTSQSGEPQGMTQSEAGRRIVPPNTRVRLQ